MTMQNTSEITLGKLEFSTSSGARVAFDLQHPLTLPAGSYSPYAVCRMCATRLPIKTLGRLLLMLVLDEMECGISRPHSYEELGRTLCKCAHSVKSTMAALRAAGLVTTSRVGFGDMSLAVSCEAFVRWAEHALSSVSGSAESVHKTEEAGSRLEEVVSKPDESVSKRVSGRTQPRRARKPSREAPAAKKEEAPAQEPQWFVKPVPLPAEPEEEVPVDNSEERAGTLKAAGRVQGSQALDDEDDFSFGSDTAETDIGHGVKMNPDL